MSEEAAPAPSIDPAAATASTSSDSSQDHRESANFSGFGSRIRSGLTSLVKRKRDPKSKCTILENPEQEDEEEEEEEVEGQQSNLLESVASNPIEGNPVDPAAVSSSDSVPSYHTAELMNEDDVVSDDPVDLSAAALTIITSEENNDEDNAEVNTTDNSSDSFTIPSAVIGVQIQAPSVLSARFLLDVVPIPFANRTQNSSATTQALPSTGATDGSQSNLRSTITEESYVSTSSGSSGFSTTTTSSNDVIEIVATLDGRRFEDDYARPYYDLSVKPVVKKLLRRIEEDPPIY